MEKNMEATKISFNRWMDKETVVPPHNRMLFSDFFFKKRSYGATKDVEEIDAITKWKSQSGKATSCNTPALWCPGNCRDSETPVAARIWKEKNEWVRSRGFLGCRNRSGWLCNGRYRTLGFWQNPQSCTAQRGNPDVNCRCVLISMCRDWVNGFYKCITPMQDA